MKIFNYSKIKEFFSNFDSKKIEEILNEFCFIKFGRYFLKLKYWPFYYQKIIESLFNYLENNKENIFCKSEFFKISNMYERENIEFIFNTFFDCKYVIDYKLGNKMFLDFNYNLNNNLGEIPIYVMKGFNKEINIENSSGIEINIHKYLKEPKSLKDIINEFSFKFNNENINEKFIKNISQIIELSNSKFISLNNKSKLQTVVIKLFSRVPIIKKNDIFNELKDSSIVNNLKDKTILADLKEILLLLAQPKGQSWILKN